MATGPLHRALLFSSALATRSQACAHTGTHATTLPQPFQRTAATHTPFTAARTLHVNCSSPSTGLQPAQQALTHSAPNTRARNPTHHKQPFPAAHANSTPAACAHNCANHLWPHHSWQTRLHVHARRHATQRNATPRHATPRHTTLIPRHATPRHITLTPRHTAPHCLHSTSPSRHTTAA